MKIRRVFDFSNNSVKSNKKSFHLLIYVLLLIVLSNNNLLSNSDSLHFKGFSYRALQYGKPLTKMISRIVITNLSTNNSIETSNSYISKAELLLTGVAQPNEIDNDFQLMNISLNNKDMLLTLRSNSNPSTKVAITDYNGKEIFNQNVFLNDGFNNIYLSVPDIAQGLYTLSFNLSTQNLFTSTFIITNNEVVFSSNNARHEHSNKQTLSSESGYRFIAYNFPETNAPAIVFVESLDDIDTLNFFFKDIASFNFRTGKLKIENLQIETQDIRTAYNPDKTIKARDTTNIEKSIDLDFQLAVNVMSPPFVKGCDEVYNAGNHVKFCNIVIQTKVRYQTYFFRYYAAIEINPKNKTLSIYDVNYQKGRGQNSLGINENLEVFFNTVSVIPYEINPESGELEAELYLENDKFNFSYESSFSHRNWDFENDYLISDGKEVLKSFIALDGITKLSLVLIP